MTTATIALSRARGAVVAGLIGFTALSWMYLAFVATRSGDMAPVLSMPMTPAWSGAQAALMAAMMMPSAIPMVLAYDSLDRGPLATGQVQLPCS